MMAATTAAVLLPAAAAAVLMLMAAAAEQPPLSIGLPGCSTACGNVSVPYPFGIGPSRCYWQGLNLTCDTRHDPPRLLLGDGTLRVTEISLRNQTVRVVGTGSIIDAAGDFNTDGWNATFGRSFTEHGYLLSDANDLVVYGCNVQATLLADVGRENPSIVAGCASFCNIRDDGTGFITQMAGDVNWTMSQEDFGCSGTFGCCRAPLTITSAPNGVQAKWLYGGNHTMEQKSAPLKVFVAEAGWISETGVLDGERLEEVPIVLGWGGIQRGLPHSDECDPDIQRRICKSEHSFCVGDQQGFTCQCSSGFGGNAYISGGCQDIDECKLPEEENHCFGECINTVGSMECRCPHGTYGNSGIKGGCVKIDSTAVAQTQHNCSTTCGDVSVPYPFGFGPSHCYWQGLNLTCDTSHNPTRLFLDSNGAFEVVEISLLDSIVRVIHHTNTSFYADPFNKVPVEPFNMDVSYMLSAKNEMILYGCDLQATLFGEHRRSSGSSNSTGDRIISRCVSTCSSRDDTGAGLPVPMLLPTQGDGDCSDGSGCCHAPISVGSTPKTLEIKDIKPNASESKNAFTFISEKGLNDQWQMILNRSSDLPIPNYMSSPLVLQWAVKHGLPRPTSKFGDCPQDVTARLCRSEYSGCQQENGGYTCHCNTGFVGNPYISYGCQDINECNDEKVRDSCFGDCNNLPGYFECRCPRGTHGDPFKPGGCISYRTGLIIGVSVASGPGLLLVLGIMLGIRKVKERRVKALKQKYFKQNGGQLLQQLVSQNADIAERMIIPVDELAKATNNFDKDRELGGGGHGTVYKGILSDLHVVAIKKSKITVQEEIDEFINEVAILSQINHRNVVKLFGCCLETEVPLLVYEFISNGTLYHHLHVDEGPRSLSWCNRLRIATEIASSIAYLHSSVSIPIIHRDIKSSNILLDDTLTSKVSDFGASRYIPIDKTGLTTRVQGTRGYLDPMYFYTSRLTEKSDVYSFGVILVELLTRKKPFSYLTTEGDGLVAHFVDLFAEGNLARILDPQLIEEGGDEVQEVAALAVSCINLRGEERPTMRHVEHTLQGLWGTKKYKNDDMVVEELEDHPEGQQIVESTRRYSLELEMIMSAREPR